MMVWYRYQIGSSGYWVECQLPEIVVVWPDGREEVQRGIRLDHPNPEWERVQRLLGNEGSSS